MAAFPRYTAFFNFPSGGRTHGWKYVVDSNLDWGQDMLRLQNYLAGRGAIKVCIEVMGLVPLEQSGIHTAPIPSSREQARQQGCLVVVGLTQMYQMQSFDGYLDWLNGMQPSDRVGDSFWVYDPGGR